MHSLGSRAWRPSKGLEGALADLSLSLWPRSQQHLYFPPVNQTCLLSLCYRTPGGDPDFQGHKPGAAEVSFTILLNMHVLSFHWLSGLGLGAGKRSMSLACQLQAPPSLSCRATWRPPGLQEEWSLTLVGIVSWGSSTCPRPPSRVCPLTALVNFGCSRPWASTEPLASRWPACQPCSYIATINRGRHADGVPVS